MKLNLLALALFASTCFAECIPFTEAPNHLGESRCVKGKVVNIGESKGGSLYLNFCEDYRQCPFTVVAFARDLRDVGDVRTLAGKEIEIHGKIKEYQGRAEIIVPPGQSGTFAAMDVGHE